jgi:CheY-like chemotaxis protein
MSGYSLARRRVLVVEDEYVLADSLRLELQIAGAIVVGPVAAVDQALALIESDQPIDGVILDINLRGQKAYCIADRLLQKGVPFVLATGYDADVLPVRFNDVQRCEKPIDMIVVAQALGRKTGPVLQLECRTADDASVNA